MLLKHDKNDRILKMTSNFKLIPDQAPPPYHAVFSPSFPHNNWPLSPQWFNTQGQLMESRQFENTKANQVLDYQTENLKNGLYFYQIEADDKLTGGRIIFIN